jgi:hypothetical protein
MVRLGWVKGTWWASIGGRNSVLIPNNRTSREDMKLRWMMEVIININPTYMLFVIRREAEVGIYI